MIQGPEENQKQEGEEEPDSQAKRGEWMKQTFHRDCMDNGMDTVREFLFRKSTVMAITTEEAFHVTARMVECSSFGTE